MPTPARMYVSTGFTPAARTRTTTWPGPATGSATSPIRITSGPPNSLTMMAFMGGIIRLEAGGWRLEAGGWWRAAEVPLLLVPQGRTTQHRYSTERGGRSALSPTLEAVQNRLGQGDCSPCFAPESRFTRSLWCAREPHSLGLTSASNGFLMALFSTTHAAVLRKGLTLPYLREAPDSALGWSAGGVMVPLMSVNAASSPTSRYRPTPAV